MSDEIWVLGGTGRVGRAVAARLVERGLPVVLTGRDAARLERLDVGGPVRTVAGSFEEVLARVTAEAPAVVVNTVGPFTTTAPQVIAACPPGTHYADVNNELPATQAVLALDPAESTYVTCAGFGAAGTESVALRLCEGRTPPVSVRVDAIAAVALEAGPVGEALARTVFEGIADGGSRVRGGRLVRARLGAEAEELTTPDGDVVRTVAVPFGELLAAWRASGAAEVVSASSEFPGGPVARVLLPVVAAAMRLRPLRELAIRRFGALEMQARPAKRAHSWARARATWADGTTTVGWLRAGEGMEFTGAVLAEVAARLQRGEGRPGAYTPAALFGTELVEAAGATYSDR